MLYMPYMVKKNLYVLLICSICLIWLKKKLICPSCMAYMPYTVQKKRMFCMVYHLLLTIPVKSGTKRKLSNTSF